MIDRRIVSLALALGLLLSTVGPTLAAPAAGAAAKQTPVGLASKTFVHYDKGFVERRYEDMGFVSATRSLQEAATATTEKACAKPGYASCPTYVYSGVHWRAGTRVVYYIDMSYSASKSPTLTRSSAKAAIDGTFRTWGLAMPASGGLIFVDGGSTSAVPGKQDGRNVIGWRWLPLGTIGQTTVYYYPSSGRIVEADVTLNSRYSWAYAPPTACSVSSIYCNPGPAGPAGAYDLRNIFTHEAGHMLMLDDLYGWSNRSLTMYGYGSPNQRSKDSLGTGDRLGVRAIY